MRKEARTECVVGCFSKSASPGIPVAGSKGTVAPSASEQQGSQCAAGLRSLAGGLPAVPGKAREAGADAGAGAGRGTLGELISSLPNEEQETVLCVLRKLDEERRKEYQCVHAVLRELAGDARKRSQK